MARGRKRARPDDDPKVLEAKKNREKMQKARQERYANMSESELKEENKKLKYIIFQKGDPKAKAKQKVLQTFLAKFEAERKSKIVIPPKPTPSNTNTAHQAKHIGNRGRVPIPPPPSAFQNPRIPAPPGPTSAVVNPPAPTLVPRNIKVALSLSDSRKVERGDTGEREKKGDFPLKKSGLSELPPKATSGLPPLPPKGTSGLPPLPTKGVSGLPSLPPKATSGLPPLPPKATSGLPPLPPKGTTKRTAMKPLNSQVPLSQAPPPPLPGMLCPESLAPLPKK